MYISIDNKETNWTDYTFILPCVSVGNVGQLTTDLIISTLCMEKVGYVHHESILPVVGNDPFAQNGASICKLMTSCEVYEDKNKKLVVLQQRSPFVKGKRKSFALWLVEWIRKQNFSKIVILTSSFAEERLDIQLQGSQFRYVASDSMKKSCEDIFRDRLGWLELEKRSPPRGLTSVSLQQMELYMPGSGIAKHIYESLKLDKSVIVMLMFCSEGDNAPDAVSMVTQLNNWLGLVPLKSDAGSAEGLLSSRPTEWKIPKSWRLVFGTRADQTLFH